MATNVLLDIPNVSNPAVLVFSMGQVKALFTKLGQRPPALPTNLSDMMPFRILITDELDYSAKHFMRLQIIKAEGLVAYQTEWII